MPYCLLYLWRLAFPIKPSPDFVRRCRERMARVQREMQEPKP